MLIEREERTLDRMKIRKKEKGEDKAKEAWGFLVGGSLVDDVVGCTRPETHIAMLVVVSLSPTKRSSMCIFVGKP